MSKYNFKSVLFLCEANSSLSQMAEGLATALFGDDVQVQSAGTEPSRLAPEALAVMSELDIDIAGQSAKSIEDVDREGLDLVVTLCSEEICPPILNNAQHLHWPLPDPGQSEDDPDEARLVAFRTIRDQLRVRLEVLKGLREVPIGPMGQEFHVSIRVPSLPEAAHFYTWLLGVAPKEWTHRYVTFVSEALRTNFVIVVSDDKKLHQDTLYHLGIDVGSKQKVVQAHQQADMGGFTIHKPARTTWRGTPLHELWLKDPGGNLIEIYARLSDCELAEMPPDQEPTFLRGALA